MPTAILNRFSGCLSQVVGSLKIQYGTTTFHRQKQCFNASRQPENGFGIVETHFTHFRLPYAAQTNPTIIHKTFSDCLTA
ncbi:hypothetical protein [Kingella oralis]|jgi:hypothetical protein|uniref:hypothetical protein n=1 Tax=Kingella oralis TaxID=505 RepID=UPI0034E5C5D7